MERFAAEPQDGQGFMFRLNFHRTQAKVRPKVKLQVMFDVQDHLCGGSRHQQRENPVSSDGCRKFLQEF